MASTYVDNFTIVDAINSGTYYAKDGNGVIDKDSYKATAAATHTIPSALIGIPTGAITDDGLNQKALYELLLKIQVNWDTAMCSLDDSSGVATTTYEAGCAFGTQHENILGTTYKITPQGMSTEALATFCGALATKFAACTALLDADATITDTDYASTLDITFSAKTGWIPPLATTDAFSITSAASKIKKTGIYQEALVDFLNTAVTNINALWVKLDADI
jgi:hypothetical protein